MYPVYFLWGCFSSFPPFFLLSYLLLAAGFLPPFPHSHLPPLPPSIHPALQPVSSASVPRRPVREWVISGKLIWPLMIGSGTCSSVPDWPRDEEANFPRCLWQIVVALNYHLLCECVLCRECTGDTCVEATACMHAYMHARASS